MLLHTSPTPTPCTCSSHTLHLSCIVGVHGKLPPISDPSVCGCQLMSSGGEAVVVVASLVLPSCKHAIIGVRMMIRAWQEYTELLIGIYVTVMIQSDGKFNSCGFLLHRAQFATVGDHTAPGCSLFPIPMYLCESFSTQSHYHRHSFSPLTTQSLPFSTITPLNN